MRGEEGGGEKGKDSKRNKDQTYNMSNLYYGIHIE